MVTLTRYNIAEFNERVYSRMTKFYKSLKPSISHFKQSVKVIDAVKNIRKNLISEKYQINVMFNTRVLFILVHGLLQTF
jgi:hypothetical protein